MALAEDCGLRERIDAMFRGDPINVTEKRAVLHTALRAPRGQSLAASKVPEAGEPVHQVLDHMAEFANQLRAGKWLGFTGKPISNIVNIGIGGSDLGPVMAYEALRYYSNRELRFRFVSNVDGTDFVEATRDLAPDETLFIVASKTFTTLETLANAESARELDAESAGRPSSGCPALRGGLDRGERRSLPSASTPRTCSDSGTGWAAATPWIRRSASPP